MNSEMDCFPFRPPPGKQIATVIRLRRLTKKAVPDVLLISYPL